MTYKQIEASREVRLWIRDIVIPAAGVGIALYANPATRDWCKQKAEEVKDKLKPKSRFTVVK